MAESNVLIVDDDDGVRRVVRRSLERAGLPVVEAADGEQALAHLSDPEIDVDVVVLDWHLPGLSGLDVLRHVRTAVPDVHVIVFTGAGTDADRERATSEGADEYLVKSIATTELVERVTSAWHGRSTRTAADEADDGADGGGDRSVRAIAHDLHNVFTVLSGYTDLVMGALDGGKPLDTRALLDDLQMIAEASRRGAALAGGLLGGDGRARTAPDDDGRRADGELVLLVEDDPDLRLAIERILADHGYTVLSAGDTETALALHRARRGDITLVLTDAVLPGSDPGAVATRLAAVDPSLPVIVISGYGDAVHGLAPGLPPGTPIVNKPFTGDILLAEIRRVLETSSAG